MLSRTAVNADSCYTVIKLLVTRAVAQRPDIMFDVLWPSNGKDWSYYKDGFFDLPNVRRVPMRFHPSKMKQVVSFCAFEHGEYFDYKYPVDVVWNHVPEIGDLIKNNVATYNPSGKSAVVNAHHYVIHDSLPYPIELDQSHVMLRQLVGCFNVDAHVFDSRHCRSMYFDNVRKYMSEYVGRQLEQNAHDIPHGPLDKDEMKEHLDTPRDEVPTFAYNHRLQNYKRFKYTFELFQQLWDEGKRFKVVIFGMPGDQMQMSWVSKFPFVEVFVSQTRKEYLAKLATCWANTINSVHETFCISAVESMAFGQPLIAPNGVTFPEITNNSPWLFDNAERQLELMRLVIDGDAAAMVVGTQNRLHVWAEYNTELWADRYLALFDEVVGTFDVMGALKNPEPIKAIFARQDKWDFQELRQAMYSTMHEGKLMASAQSFPANRIKRLAHQLGFKDARAPRTGELLLIKEDSKHASKR